MWSRPMDHLRNNFMGNFRSRRKIPRRRVNEAFLGAAGRHQLHIIRISKITNQGDSSHLSFDMEKDRRLTSTDRSLLREGVFDEVISKANILKFKPTKTVIIITVDLKRTKTSKCKTAKESMKKEENRKTIGKEKEVTKQNLEHEEDGQRKMQQKKKENDRNEESKGKEGWPWWPGL